MTSTATDSLAWGNLTERVVVAVRDHGPCTLAEVLALVEGDREVIRKALRRLVQPSQRALPLGVRRLHIMGWVREVEGEREYPRPVYAFGHGSNAKRPAPRTRSQIVVEWRRNKRERRRKNFVFNLGATV